MNCGVTMRGKCWSYGSQLCYDPALGSYYQFVLRVPSTIKVSHGKARVYIHWYNYRFRPEAGMRLECNGSIGSSWIREIIDKSPSQELTLVCYGDEVQLQDNKKAP